MELSGKQIADLHRSAEVDPIGARKPNRIARLGYGVVAVNKVKIRQRPEPPKHRIPDALRCDLIPPHVRNFKRAMRKRIEMELDDLTGNDAQSLMLATFETHVQQELQSKADSKEGPIGLDPILDKRDPIAASKLMDRIAKRADARQDDVGRRLQVPVGFAHYGNAPGSLDPFGNTPKVPHLVIDDPDLRWLVHRVKAFLRL